MKSNSRILSLLLASLLALIPLAGCQDSDPIIKELPDDYLERLGISADAVYIGDWTGTWNTLSAYVEEEGREELKSGLSKSVGRDWQTLLASDLAACRIDGTALTALSKPQREDGLPQGNSLFNLAYTPMGVEQTGDETWYLYQADGEGEYQYLILQEVEERDGLRSFRYRYGGEGFDALLERTDWCPIMVDAQAAQELLLQQFG